MAKKRVRSPDETKAKLLKASAKLFAEYGYYGVSVEQISKKSGVSVSMVSHHFGGKENLYRAVLNEFGSSRLDQLERLLTDPVTVDEFRTRLEVLINELIVYHLQNPEVTTILLHDVAAKKYRDKELHIQLFSFSTKIAGYFEAAQKRKIVRKDIDALSATALLYFAFIGLIQFDAEIKSGLGASIENADFRTAAIKRTLDMVLNGVLN